MSEQISDKELIEKYDWLATSIHRMIDILITEQKDLDKRLQRVEQQFD